MVYDVDDVDLGFRAMVRYFLVPALTCACSAVSTAFYKILEDETLSYKNAHFSYPILTTL